MTFVVLLKTGSETGVLYGPFDTRLEANEFAEFMSKEVDPATVESLRSPTLELLAFWRNELKRPDRADKPEYWPPKPGQVWQDRDLNRWVCAGTNASNTPYLVCIAYQADDSAEEILRKCGPLKLVHSFDPHEEEVPF